MKGSSTTKEMVLLRVYWYECFSDIDSCVRVSSACFGIRSGVYVPSHSCESELLSCLTLSTPHPQLPSSAAGHGLAPISLLNPPPILPTQPSVAQLASYPRPALALALPACLRACVHPRLRMCSVYIGCHSGPRALFNLNQVSGFGIEHLPSWDVFGPATGLRCSHTLPSARPASLWVGRS
jgi:hypothetical protein